MSKAFARLKDIKEFAQRHYRGVFGEMPEFRTHDPNPMNTAGKAQPGPKPRKKGKEYD